GLCHAVSGLGIPGSLAVAARPRDDHAVSRTSVRPPSRRGGAGAHRLEVSLRSGTDGPWLRFFCALRIARPAVWMTSICSLSAAPRYAPPASPTYHQEAASVTHQSNQRMSWRWWRGCSSAIIGRIWPTARDERQKAH